MMRKECCAYVRYPEDGDLVLLVVSPVFFVDENEVEVVPSVELLVHVSECRCKVETAQEQPDGYGLSYDEA